MDDHSHQGDDRKGGSAPAQDRIVDRKIERRALPASFSSNLGRKGLSPGRKASDRFVKAMVSMFEKSTGTSGNRQPNKPSEIHGNQGQEDAVDNNGKLEDRVIIHTPQHYFQQGQPIRSIPTPMFSPAHVGYQVEEYSLTLLKHKSYFNNRPLARCLDDLDGNKVAGRVSGRNSQDVKSKKEGGKEGMGEKKENMREGTGLENKRAVSSNQNDASSPIAQLDNLMCELLILQGTSESTAANSSREEEKRDPEEAKRFWNNVRGQLWIENEEIYGEISKSAAQIDAKGVRDEGNEAHAFESTLRSEVKNAPDEENETHTLEPLSPQTTTAIFFHPVPEPKSLPPPMPTRTPPPVPVAQAQSSSTDVSRSERHMATPSLEELFSETELDDPAWDEAPPTASVRLSMSMPGGLDISNLISSVHPALELPAWFERGRPLPIPPVETKHSRYPSSSGSGPWVRPPTWRSPSSMRSSSPPPTPTFPPNPPSVPASTASGQRARYGHSRHRHQPRSSKTSTSTFISRESVAVAGSSDRSFQNRTRTPTVSTASSVAARSRAASRASSSTDLAAVNLPRAPRRRLTTEEKMSEIDAFLSPENQDIPGGWI
ncbi:hypothetical protein VTI74DRAFT_819 [Chaetomium olivicolor]